MTIVAFAKRSTWNQLHVKGLENSCSWLHSGKIIVSSAWLVKRQPRLCVRAQVRCSIWNSRSVCRLCVFSICRYQSHLSLITQQYSCECTLWFRQSFDACNFSHRRIFFDNRRNKVRSRAVVFPSSEPREINAKKEEILGWWASLGLQFCRSPLRVPSIYCDLKER